MTGEEMERAIEFLLKSQATLEGQIAETSKQLQAYAETQTQFIEIATRTMSGLAEAQSRTHARLDRLAALIEQHVTEGHH